MIFTRISLLLVSVYFFFTSCTSAEDYKKDLFSEDINKIDRACYELGEAKDTTAIKPLLTKILDPRVSINLKFKGMSVNYCRLVALNKISDVDFKRKIDQVGVDTAATFFYLDWAIKNSYLKDTNEVDIYYYK